MTVKWMLCCSILFKVNDCEMDALLFYLKKKKKEMTANVFNANLTSSSLLDRLNMHL